MTENPHSWESGPPESKQESWNWERRTELLNISSAVLQAQVMGTMRNRESWEGEGNPLDSVDPKLAVRLAKQLIEEAEIVRPKL
jgi:hypothetical protein